MDIAVTSTEYVHANITATANGTPITVASPPQVAFLPASNTNNPATEDWLTGEWNGSQARILVGPNGGTVTLEPGAYKMWISFAAGLETPVKRVGQVTVY